MKHFLWVVLNKVQLWFSILSVADSFLQKVVIQDELILNINF